MKTIIASVFAVSALFPVGAFANEARHNDVLVSKVTIEQPVRGSFQALGQASYTETVSPVKSASNDPARSAWSGK